MVALTRDLLHLQQNLQQILTCWLWWCDRCWTYRLPLQASPKPQACYTKRAILGRLSPRFTREPADNIDQSDARAMRRPRWRGGTQPTIRGGSATSCWRSAQNSY